jgi:hypothetical protein
MVIENPTPCPESRVESEGMMTIGLGPGSRLELIVGWEVDESVETTRIKPKKCLSTIKGTLPIWNLQSVEWLCFGCA